MIILVKKTRRLSKGYPWSEIIAITLLMYSTVSSSRAAVGTYRKCLINWFLKGVILISVVRSADVTGRN